MLTSGQDISGYPVHHFPEENSTKGGVHQVVDGRMLGLPCRFPDVGSRNGGQTGLVKVIAVAPKGIEVDLPMKGMIDLVGGELVIIPIPGTQALMIQEILKADIGIGIFGNETVEGGWKCLRKEPLRTCPPEFLFPNGTQGFINAVFPSDDRLKIDR